MSSQYAFSLKEQQDLFQAVDNKTRQTLQHKANQSNFLKIIGRVLDEYGLAARLAAAKATGQKLRILQIGCGEGLYLHDVAAVLEERGLLEGVSLYGVDNSAATVITAEEFARQSKPPRSYLTFFQHTLTQPLGENPSLAMLNLTSFDFIFALLVFSYMPGARGRIEQLYRDNLRPGGLLYLCNVDTRPQNIPAAVPHPALAPFLNYYWQLTQTIHNGEEIVLAAAEWLRQAGACDIQQITENSVASSDNPQTLANLQNVLLICQDLGRQMVARKLMTQAEFDQRLAQVYRELDKRSRATFPYVNTLATKP